MEVVRNSHGDWCVAVVRHADHASTTPVTRALVPIIGARRGLTRREAEEAAERMHRRGLI